MPAMILLKAKLHRPMQRSLFLLFFFFTLCAYSQVNTSFFVDGKLEKRLDILDSLTLSNEVLEYKLSTISKGYFFAGLDSIVVRGNERFLYLHRGEKMTMKLEDFNKGNHQRRLRKRLRYLSNHGYPFASIRVDSIERSDGVLNGKIVEEKGPYILNDSSFLYNPLKTKLSYIHALLEHVPGEQFKESNYGKINDRITRSPFLSFGRPADISFQNEKAKLYLDLKENPASSFEGVVGLQQGSGRSTVVGSLDLNVQNLFRSGKELGIAWESFSSESQQLALSYGHPFLLGSRISPHFQFDLLKQDSLFLKRTAGIKIGTYVSAAVELLLGYEGSTGSLLSTEEASLLSGDIADFDSDIYSVHLRRGRLDKTRELETNYAWEIAISLGSKQIKKNFSVASAFYDTLDLTTDVFKFDFSTVFNKRVSQRQQISQSLKIGLIDNTQLLNNERYRLGGLNTLRGFNEKSFFADQYFLSRTEFRSFFEKGSFLYLFYDQLIFKNENFRDSPFGTGLGFVLATLSGQFNFALAIGQAKNQPIDFSNMNVHFGYITNF